VLLTSPCVRASLARRSTRPQALKHDLRCSGVARGEASARPHDRAHKTTGFRWHPVMVGTDVGGEPLEAVVRLDPGNVALQAFDELPPSIVLVYVRLPTKGT